ncbi:MAG: SPASM domain-containing protein [Cyclobacteriaceae bacterium]|nr:SPASM domain-containing protein [Cyclobacteriaceae bacterium]
MRDTLHLLSKSSMARWRNAAAIWSSYQYARMTRTPHIAGMPISISVEPTTSCNLRCPECPSGLRSFTRSTGMMDTALMDDVLQQLGPTLFWLTFYFQGEPYLHRDLLAMVRRASTAGIYTSTSTNGHYFDDETARATVESGLDRLIISIDGTTQEAYASYRRGGILSRVLEGTRNVIRWKKYFASATPHVIFQFLVVRQNEHQIPELKRMARELGVDEVKLKTAQIYDYELGSPLIPRNDRYSRYAQNTDGTWRIKNGMANHCWKMWHSCVITWDGRVVPCCFDKDAQHELGNIRNESFGSIWNGERYRAFRAALLKSRSEIDICRNCTEGTKVWA